MNRRQTLFAEARALGLNPVWRTSTIASLQALLETHRNADRRATFDAVMAARARRANFAPSDDASFEEQFDTVWPADVHYQDALDRLMYRRMHKFTLRVQAGIDLVRLRGLAENRANIREASSELVGGFYVLTHPESAVEVVERLRRLKREVLLAPRDGVHAHLRCPVLSYLTDWEAALTPEQVQIYL